MAEVSEHNPAVLVEYRTPDRFGQRFEVSLHDAIEHHSDAQIVSYADGRAFDGKDARKDVKAVRADIREERAAAKPDADKAEKPAPKKDAE